MISVGALVPVPARWPHVATVADLSYLKPRFRTCLGGRDKR